MAFSWNPGALAPTKNPSVPAEQTVGAWPHAGGQLLVGASALGGEAMNTPEGFAHTDLVAASPLSALEGAEPRQAPRFTGGHPRLFAPLLTGPWCGASAPSSALSEAAAPPAGALTGSPAGHRSYLPGYEDPMAAASLSALGEQGTPSPTEAGASTPPCSLSALTAAGSLGAPVSGSSGEVMRAATARPAAVSASSPYPMRRRRALLFGSVRAW